jgi:hypothetical protein
VVFGDAQVVGNWTVRGKGGTFLGIVKGDYFGAWWVHIVSVGIKLAMEFFVGGGRGYARGSKEVQGELGCWYNFLYFCHGERWITCCEGSYVMALECLDGSLRFVGTVVVGRHKLAGDVALAKVLDKLLGHGVVGDFVDGYE